jgi:hypothetical protein
MNKDEDSDIDDLDLDELEAESLPLHNLQGDASVVEPSSSSRSRLTQPESTASRPTAFLDGLRGLASFFVYFVSNNNRNLTLPPHHSQAN